MSSHQTNYPAVTDTSSYTGTVNNLTENASRQENIREIYSCLAPCNQCTGVYIDTISGTRLRIICRHNCHSTGQSTDRDQALEEVGEPVANARETESFPEGTRNDY